MKKTALLVAALASLVIVSGCMGNPGSASGDGGDTPPPAAPELMAMPMDVHDCKFIMAVVPTDEASVAKYIPKGFRPLRVGESPLDLPPDPRGNGQAMLGMEAELCDRVLQPDMITYKPGATGSLWIPVVPPEWWQQRGTEFYIVKLDIIVPEAHAKEDLQHLGLPARTGGATFVDPTEAIADPGRPTYIRDFGGMNLYQAELVFDEGGTITYEGGGGFTKNFVAAPFQDFTCVGFHPRFDEAGEPLMKPDQDVTPDQYYRGHTDFHADVIHESIGVLTVSGGRAGEILGDGQHFYYALVGYGSYYNMEMFLPDPHAMGAPEH